MGSLQDLIMGVLAQSDKWLSIADIASRISDKEGETYRPKQIRVSMHTLRYHKLVDRKIEFNSFGSRVFVFRKK